MKTLLCLLACLCISVTCKAQDTTRILFIGNSFTYYNNLPQMVKAFADSAHLPVSIGMHAPGGISVGDTAQGNQAHMKNPVLFQLIRSKKWDVVVIQDNQGRFVRDSAVFSGASKVVQGHLNLMDSVKKNNDCAKIVLFAGWAWKFGMPPYGNTGVETMRRILVNYCVLNDTMKEIIAPIAEAWIKASTHLPSVNLWDTDNAHSSYAGSYLSASVIFSSVFNLPAKTFNYNGAIAPATAYTLRSFADSAVFDTDFHTKYNLGGMERISPLYLNGQLTLPGTYSGYSWYKNGLLIGTTAGINYTGNGIYKALVKEQDGCLVKTCSYSGAGIQTKLAEENSVDIQLFPNPVSGGRLFIRSELSPENITLYTVSGIPVKTVRGQFPGELIIDTKNLVPGCYTLIAETSHRKIYKKVLIGE